MSPHFCLNEVRRLTAIELRQRSKLSRLCAQLDRRGGNGPPIAVTVSVPWKSAVAAQEWICISGACFLRKIGVDRMDKEQGACKF